MERQPDEVCVVRRWLTEKSTIGELTFGEFRCFTLEDRLRDPGVKVWGQTAIPAGRYHLVMAWSNRFQRSMPRLLNVPMFDGILVHSGNTDANTEGCVLVGMEKGTDAILRSREAFGHLLPLIKAAQPHLWITLTDEIETDTRVLTVPGARP